jgi:hypothetical protein
MRSFGDVEVVVGRPVRAVDGLPVVSVGAVLATVAIVTVTVVLGVAVAVAAAVRAARAVTGVAAVTVVIAVAVTVTTIILARGVVATARARRPAAGRRATRATVPIAAVEAPRSRRRSASPLDLQDIVAADTLVMHVMVRVIRIAAILVLYEGEQPAAGRPRSRNVTADQAAIALEFVREVARASAVAEAGHVEGGPVA